MLHVGLKSGSVGGTFHAHGRSHPLSTHGGDQRYVLAPVSRSLPVCTLSFGSPSIKSREGDVRPALVHEDELVGLYKAPHVLSPSTSLFFVSLGGTQTLFLSVHSSFSRMARLMVAMETLTPRRSSHSLQWRSRVAWSFSSSCFHRRCFSSGVARMRRLRPVEGLGSRSSPARRRFT